MSWTVKGQTRRSEFTLHSSTVLADNTFLWGHISEKMAKATGERMKTTGCMRSSLTWQVHAEKAEPFQGLFTGSAFLVFWGQMYFLG